MQKLVRREWYLHRLVSHLVIQHKNAMRTIGSVPNCKHHHYQVFSPNCAAAPRHQQFEEQSGFLQGSLGRHYSTLPGSDTNTRPHYNLAVNWGVGKNSKSPLPQHKGGGPGWNACSCSTPPNNTESTSPYRRAN